MRELRVHLRFEPGGQVEVGTLAQRGREVWFVYDEAFVASGLQISPIRLPVASGLLPHRFKAGVPIPGVFNDARPDGWGLKLLHRAFQARGRVASSVSPLDELAWLGSHTMGALGFEPVTGPGGDLPDAVELAALAAHAQRVWDDRVTEALPALVRAGGPSGGARPKALIGMPADGGPGFVFGEGELPPGWEAWLVKFPTAHDDAEVGRREAAWMAMARDAGLEVPAFRVLGLAGVGDAYAVRRFDRPGGGRRLHMLSAAGAIDVDFRTAAADYHHLLQATRALCPADAAQALAMFRLAVFNVLAVNQDDHLKNVAWLMDAAGRWRLAPGFDLTYSPSPSGEHTTAVAGEARSVTRSHLDDLAGRGGLKPASASAVIAEVAAATSQVGRYLADAGCAGPVSRAAGEAVRAATARGVG